MIFVTIGDTGTASRGTNPFVAVLLNCQHMRISRI